jgi:hypothetical protein
MEGVKIKDTEEQASACIMNVILIVNHHTLVSLLSKTVPFEQCFPGLHLQKGRSVMNHGYDLVCNHIIAYQCSWR